MTSRTSSPYILAYMADAAGCGYHRIAQPLEIIIKNGYALGRADFQIWPLDNLKSLQPDIVIWQRQHEDYQIENMRVAREALPNCFFCYEIDDILSACPDWSPHKQHIPYDVDERMTRALMHCHAVTCSTRALAQHLRRLCGNDFDVRVSPNMVSKEDIVKADEARAKNSRLHFRKRIGWGGGISHGGDLDLLIPAMREFRDKTEWVFLGQKPQIDIPVEFHEGVPPQEYLAKLASLDLDLMVAPLVENLFNRCKSNLRLLEAGACRYPVIASPVEPYVDGNPPVYSYAEPENWIDKVGEFLADPDPKPKAESLRQWVQRRFLFEDRLDEKMKLWSPRSTKVFIPKRRIVAADKLVLVSAEPFTMPEGYEVKTSFEEVIDRNCDVLYVRKGTLLTKEFIEELQKHLVGNVAGVFPLTNDGGFPKAGIFLAIDKEKAELLNKICHDIAKDVTIQVPFPYGPVLLLARKAIDVFGFPEITSLDDTETAITEWGIMTTARGFQTLLCCGMYTHSVFPAAQKDINELSRRMQLRYNLQSPPDPLRDLRAHLELAFYRESYTTPLPSQNSNYDEWYSIYDTLSDKDKEFVYDYQANCNFGIATYNATRWGGSIEAPWMLFSDFDSSLAPQVIYFFNEAFKANPDALFAYADHDFITAEGKRDKHDFKPKQIDYHLLLGRDYVSQICAVRTNAIDFENEVISSTDIYGLALRIYDKYGVKGFVHVPRILAHLKELTPESDNALARKKMTMANSHLARLGLTLKLIPHPYFPQYNQIQYKTNIPDPFPSVTIIIPTKNRVEMLSPCIESLIHTTNYPNFEILVIDNGSTNPIHIEYQKLISEKYSSKLTLLSWPKKYNWAELNNWAARYAKGEFLLFLNDDTRFAESDWLSEMVGAACCPKVGAVGAKLLHNSGTIQHVGVISNKGLCGHIHKMLPNNLPGYNGIATLSHANVAVTGACLLVSADLFKEIGGFDERLAHNFNDVAFCLELYKKGYTNLVACSAVLQHLEGITRISPGTPEGQHLVRSESLLLSQLYPEEEPYWNPNLLIVHVMGGTLVSGLNYDLLRWPPLSWPWRGDKRSLERVLIFGDDGVIWTEEARSGNVCYLAMLNGYSLQLARPNLENVPVLDIRDYQSAKKILGELGITKIVVRSILGGTPEILPFLTSLNYPIEYRPNSAESVCPRLDCKQDGQMCESGWRDTNICSQCLDSYNSPFGNIPPDYWRQYWTRFLSKTKTIDLKAVHDDLKMPLWEVHVIS